MTMKMKTTKISETWMLTGFAKFVPTKITNHTVVGNVHNINCTADHRERASKNQVVYNIAGNSWHKYFMVVVLAK